ncbi:MAG TPA: response regulator [Candidatus Acidoferrales bacterium]|nr:response regulator [Candidatus Acidoferrales bacterium]
MRILIAEDNEPGRELLMVLLQKSGHTVTGVRDGREALAALEAQNFEVVFMDEEMPGVNGLEATRAIHQSNRSGGKRPVIIGLSGNSTDEDEKRCLAAGMDAFLPKPIRMAELFALLAVLSRRSQPPASQPADSAPSGALPEGLAAHLLRATGGNKEILRALVKSFLADAPRKLFAIRRAIAQGDGERLASVAHALKGSLGLFGAHKAVAAALNLQSIGRSGAIGSAANEFRALEEELRRLRSELLALDVVSKPAKKRSAGRRKASRPVRRRKG